MNDQTIPAEKVREIAAAMRASMRRDDPEYSSGAFLAEMSDYIRDLHALLPALPTLADMTHVARRECRWMQCEVRGDRRIITLIRDDDDHNYAVTLAPSGYTAHCSFESVTPRPDLPRMTWPGDTPEAVPPNTLDVGSVWIGVDALTRACEESGRDQIVVSDFGGYVSVWDNDAEWWEGSAPPRTTPYTIIHTGKEADQ